MAGSTALVSQQKQGFLGFLESTCITGYFSLCLYYLTNHLRSHSRDHYARSRSAGDANVADCWMIASSVSRRDSHRSPRQTQRRDRAIASHTPSTSTIIQSGEARSEQHTSDNTVDSYSLTSDGTPKDFTVSHINRSHLYPGWQALSPGNACSWSHLSTLNGGSTRFADLGYPKMTTLARWRRAAHCCSPLSPDNSEAPFRAYPTTLPSLPATRCQLPPLPIIPH